MTAPRRAEEPRPHVVDAASGEPGDGARVVGRHRGRVAGSVGVTGGVGDVGPGFLGPAGRRHRHADRVVQRRGREPVGDGRLDVLDGGGVDQRAVDAANHPVESLQRLQFVALAPELPLARLAGGHVVEDDRVAGDAAVAALDGRGPDLVGPAVTPERRQSVGGVERQRRRIEHLVDQFAQRRGPVAVEDVGAGSVAVDQPPGGVEDEHAVVEAADGGLPAEPAGGRPQREQAMPEGGVAEGETGHGEGVGGHVEGGIIQRRHAQEGEDVGQPRGRHSDQQQDRLVGVEEIRGDDQPDEQDRPGSQKEVRVGDEHPEPRAERLLDEHQPGHLQRDVFGEDETVIRVSDDQSQRDRGNDREGGERPGRGQPVVAGVGERKGHPADGDGGHTDPLAGLQRDPERGVASQQSRGVQPREDGERDHQSDERARSRLAAPAPGVPREYGRGGHRPPQQGRVDHSPRHPHRITV
jgi:hypothetical protein